MSPTVLGRRRQESPERREPIRRRDAHRLRRVREAGRRLFRLPVTALFDETSPAAGLVAAEVEAIEVFARAGFDVEVLAAPARPEAARRRATRRVA